MNDEELVELIERTIDDYFYASDMPIAERIAAALRSAGFQVFIPEDCETQRVDELDHEAGPQWMWPTPFAPVPAGTYFLVPADSGGSG